MNTRVSRCFEAWCLVFFLSGCLPVLAVPNNLVQNGDFASGFTDWSGNNLEGVVNNPHAPDGEFGLAGDLYQNVTTIPGQTYDITFSAAADLFFGPSLTLALKLNGQTEATIVTPPYSYNDQINRYDQMVWEQYTYLYSATSGSTRLEFADQNTFDFGLGAVSMTQVPESTGTITLLGFSMLLVALSKIRKRKQCF